MDDVATLSELRHVEANAEVKMESSLGQSAADPVVRSFGIVQLHKGAECPAWRTPNNPGRLAVGHNLEGLLAVLAAREVPRLPVRLTCAHVKCLVS